MSKYIAKQSIGHFRPGQEIKGLEEEKLQALLASGAIEEAKAKEEPKDDGTAARFAELEKANAEFKVKVAELEKALSDSQAALKKATTETRKTATQTDK